MSDKKLYAVLTGDVINSSDAKGEEKDKLIQLLKEAFGAITKKSKSKNPSPSFDIFRGDSFQGVLADPAEALKAALIVRTTLIRNHSKNEKTDWDARIAIGVGSIDYLPENISEGDGPAFRNSGPVLDELKGDFKSAITESSGKYNHEFKTYCAFLDAVINKWTPPQAEIVYRLLLNKTKKEIGKDLDISQAAVHYRVKAAGWFAIREFLTRYETVIENIKDPG
ncbi:MAG: hypothetical protein JXR26_11045 [Balneolaceae bacterium]|nr:hypothetical protein [Balneolaceae bacterium]